MTRALPSDARPIHDGRRFLGHVANRKGTITAWTPAGRRLGEFSGIAPAVTALKAELVLEGARAS